MDKQRLQHLAGIVTEGYQGKTVHGLDEEHMWDWVEDEVLSGRAQRNPTAFFAEIIRMAEDRAESQM